MPWFAIFIFSFFLLINCSSKKADQKPARVTQPKTITYTPNPDTLTIEHEMAHQPFLTDTISVEAIKVLFGKEYQISKKAVPNRFIKNQMDTLVTVRKGKSYIRLYAVSQADKCFYEAAEIQDALPLLQKSIKIGQTKEEIKRVFPALNKTRVIPDYIEIAAGEGTDFLYLIFANNRLRKVEYHPYLD